MHNDISANIVGRRKQKFTLAAATRRFENKTCKRSEERLWRDAEPRVYVDCIETFETRGIGVVVVLMRTLPPPPVVILVVRDSSFFPDETAAH